MKAIIKQEPKDGALVYADMPDPALSEGGVMVEIESAGICGTDVALWHWHEAVVGQYAPKFPLIIGHEFGGRTRSSFAGGRYPAGTLVAVNPQLACGRCHYCHLGRPTLCVDRRLMGGKVNGGWADFVCVPEQNLYPFPEGTDPAMAALAEPLCVATHAVCERVPTRQGDVVVVVGAGPIGLLCLILAKNAGASKVFVTGLDADRQRLALVEQLGGIPINVEKHDPLKVVAATQWDGADIVYETSGSAAVVPQALALARRSGRVGLIGLCHGESRLITTPIVLRELEVIGSRGYNDTTWAELMRIIPAIAADAARLISHRMPLEAAVDALRLVESRQANKILLSPKLH